MEERPHALLLKYPGTNCDEETARALRLVGFDAKVVYADLLDRGLIVNAVTEADPTKRVVWLPRRDDLIDFVARESRDGDIVEEYSGTPLNIAPEQATGSGRRTIPTTRSPFFKPLAGPGSSTRPRDS